MRVIALATAVALILSGCSVGKEATSGEELRPHKNSLKAAQYNTQLGLGYLRQGQVQRAKHKLLLALSQDRHSVVVNDAYAYFLEQTGDYEQAEQYYRRALKLQPHAGRPLNNYGIFLCRRGAYSQAEQYFLRAVRDPHYLNTAEAYANAGICARQQGDLAKAKRYLWLAYQRDPKRPNVLLELADSAYQQADYQNCLAYLEQYFAVAPAAVDNLRLAYKTAKHLGDSEKAANYRWLLTKQLHMAALRQVG